MKAKNSRVSRELSGLPAERVSVQFILTGRSFSFPVGVSFGPYGDRRRLTECSVCLQVRLRCLEVAASLGFGGKGAEEVAGERPPRIAAPKLGRQESVCLGFLRAAGAGLRTCTAVSFLMSPAFAECLPGVRCHTPRQVFSFARTGN